MDYLVFHKLLQIVDFNDIEARTYGQRVLVRQGGRSVWVSVWIQGEELREKNPCLDEEFGGGQGIESVEEEYAQELRVSLW